MRVITIGRDEANDKVITDPCTSRHHLQIILHDDGHFTLSDFGSTNGTYVNGQKISGEIPLNDMDIVRIGNTTIPWRMYFDDTDVDEGAPSDNGPQREETGKAGGRPDIKAIIGFFVGIVMIIGGLSGALVLKGTGSSMALVIVGAILTVFNAILMLTSLKNKK